MFHLLPFRSISGMNQRTHGDYGETDLSNVKDIVTPQAPMTFIQLGRKYVRQ